MRWKKINDFFQQLAENPYIIVIATLASLLSYFTVLYSGVEWVCNLAGIYAKWIIDIVTFCTLLLVFVASSSIIKYFTSRQRRKRLRIYGHSTKSTLWQDPTGERIREFQELRTDAKNSILVMGIGLTFFSQDLNYLKTLLEKNLTVRILMMDPDVISQIYDASMDKYPVIVKSDFFNEYFERQGYNLDVIPSFSRLKAFILERKKIKNKKGHVSFKKYPYFLPLNVTMIDEGDRSGEGRMLIEWCIPFSNWRISGKLSQSQHREFFEILTKSIEELWNRSELVVDDNPES